MTSMKNVGTAGMRLSTQLGGKLESILKIKERTEAMGRTTHPMANPNVSIVLSRL